MMRKLGLVVASMAALAVVFIGARTFACGDDSKHKTASAVNGTSCCPYSGAVGASTASGHACPMMKASAQTASDAKGEHSCGMAGCTHSGCTGKSMSNSSMTQAGCGMKGASSAFYAANVYDVRDGQEWAVCQGKQFEVTATTPYYDLGNARYYFADKNCMSKCSEKMASVAADLDREAVSLATVEGNVKVASDGQKYAVCPISHDQFPVTSGMPVKVMNGKKYYVCNEKCASELMQMADYHPAN